MANDRPRRSLEERFWEKVDRSGPCWLWMAACSSTGYCQIRVDRRSVYVHRLSYEWHVGPIPDGYQIDHLCRVRLCVNPRHLQAVTQLENIRRGVSPNVLVRKLGYCKRGHEMTLANTYHRPKGGIMCRACGLLRAARPELMQQKREYQR